MSSDTHATSEHGGDAPHASMRTYLIGFALSVVLTAIPFWMVMSGTLSQQATALSVVAFAVLQILVQTVCFLHVNRRAEDGWVMLAMIFTGILLLITIVGSLWIMYHLNTNMMAMNPDVSATP